MTDDDIVKLYLLADKSDMELYQRWGYNDRYIRQSLYTLFTEGRVLVVWCALCGKNDPSVHANEKWVALVKAAKEIGLDIEENSAIHANNWTSRYGWMWFQSMYTLRNFKPDGLEVLNEK